MNDGYPSNLQEFAIQNSEDLIDSCILVELRYADQIRNARFNAQKSQKMMGLLLFLAM